MISKKSAPLFTSKQPKINGLLLLAAVVGLVLGSAAPASANHLSIIKATSQGIGEEWGPGPDEFCPGYDPITGINYETTYYFITENVNYQVVESGTAVAHYAGLITMNLQHGSMVVSTLGAGPGDCLDSLGRGFLPAPVPLTKARVTSTNGTNCATRPADLTVNAGTYQRSYSNFKFDYNVSCTIVGNVAGATGTRVVWLNFDVFGARNADTYPAIYRHVYLKGITHQVAISGSGH